MPNTIAITASTRTHYGEIISAIITKHPKKNPSQKTERYLVQLGIDLNDVWQAAVALEHGLVFATRDGMDKVREAVKGKGLEIENWIDDPIPSPSASQQPVSQSVSASQPTTSQPVPDHP